MTLLIKEAALFYLCFGLQFLFIGGNLTTVVTAWGINWWAALWPTWLFLFAIAVFELLLIWRCRPPYKVPPDITEFVWTPGWRHVLALVMFLLWAGLVVQAVFIAAKLNGDFTYDWFYMVIPGIATGFLGFVAMLGILFHLHDSCMSWCTSAEPPLMYGVAADGVTPVYRRRLPLAVGEGETERLVSSRDVAAAGARVGDDERDARRFVAGGGGGGVAAAANSDGVQL